jgi:hypothetical protein
LHSFNNTITLKLQFSHKLNAIRGFKTEACQEAMKACLEKKAETDAIQEEIKACQEASKGLVRKDGGQQENIRG